VNFGWCWSARAGDLLVAATLAGSTPTLCVGSAGAGRDFLRRGITTNEREHNQHHINQTVIGIPNIGVRNAVTVVDTRYQWQERAAGSGEPFKAQISCRPACHQATRLTACGSDHPAPEAPERVKRVSWRRSSGKEPWCAKRSSVSRRSSGAEMPVKKRDEPPPEDPGAQPASRSETREKDQLSPRVEQQPPIKQPSISKGRPAPIPTLQRQKSASTTT